MEPQKLEHLLQLLETIQQGLAYLQGQEDAAVRQAVADGRRAVMAELEAALQQPLARQINAGALDDAAWLGAAYRVLEEANDPFEPQHLFDREFMQLLDHIWDTDEETLVYAMKDTLRQWKKAPNGKALYQQFVEYFAKYPLWGTLAPERGDYDTLKRRAAVLKRHSYDFLWLYRRLGDALSRRTLTAILANWTALDLSYPQTVKSIFPDYWEPDIFPDNRGEVLVDVGAFTGDSVAQYVRMYGRGYRKIYAYEVSPDSCAAMRANVEKLGLHDVVIRNKGAGSQPGELFLSRSAADASANQLSADARGERIEVAPLDEDLPEPVTFLKMDIEGAEWDTLLGCEKIISQQHPRLAVCVYHGYDDLWRIPALIDSMYPAYEMYLRHYGGNLIPTEFVLLCRPRPGAAAEATAATEAAAAAAEKEG